MLAQRLKQLRFGRVQGALIAAILVVQLGADGQDQRLVIRELWTTKGSPELGEFGFIAGMSQGPQGEIWVADNRTRRILAVGLDGRVLRVVAREGPGPGEVFAPTLLAPRPNGGIANYDLNRRAIHLFTSDSRHEASVPLRGLVVNPKGFVILPNGDFLISGGMLGRQESIYRFGSDGALVASWHPVPTTSDPG